MLRRQPRDSIPEARNLLLQSHREVVRRPDHSAVLADAPLPLWLSWLLYIVFLSDLGDFFWRASLHHPSRCQTWAPRLEARTPPAPPGAPPTKQQASTELPWLQELPHLDIVMINMAESCRRLNQQKKNGSRTIMINDYNKQAATNCDNFLIVPSVSSRFWILLRLFSAFSSSSSTSICKSAILSTFGKRWLLGKHRNYSCCPYRHPSFSLRKSP